MLLKLGMTRKWSQSQQAETAIPGNGATVDSLLSPLTIDEKNDSIGACAGLLKIWGCAFSCLRNFCSVRDLSDPTELVSVW